MTTSARAAPSGHDHTGLWPQLDMTKSATAADDKV